MAETAVCYLIDKLIPLLAEEVNLLRGVHGEVSDIKNELESIRAFLKDADKRAESEGDIHDGVKTWVKELTKVAFKIEDVVDVYIYHMSVQRPNRHRFIAFLNKIACFVIKLKPQHQIAIEIREIKANIRSIMERSERYGFRSLQQTSTSTTRKRYDPRKAPLFLNETEVVGLESPMEELISVLENTSPQRVVTAVVGMAGLGKTTLAKQVYDRIKGHFDCHAWITVSESYKTEELLRSLIEKFSGTGHVGFPTQNTVDTTDEVALKTQLREFLQKKRYLVIFDDVWNNEFWGDIEHALPSNQNSGRILITTRKAAVANSCRRSSSVHVHMFQSLLLEKAMELFSKKTFEFEYGGGCPPELEELSVDIVFRCQGLPLAIVAVAGILSTKDKTVYQWRRFLNSLSVEMLNHSDTERILMLSYNDLPYNLKCCVLYFGMFPKGYSIRCGRLIRQWIAEGFVKSEPGKSLEDVAKEFLTELVDRSLVEISEVDDEGKAKTCRIHDLLHAVVFKKMEDLSFCQVFSGDELSNFNAVARRLSIIGSSIKIPSTIDVSCVRWFSISSQDEMLNSTVSMFAASFKLLKELDFEDFPHLDHLPENIGNLFHLRYLSVRGTRVKYLPKSVEKLVNLETLDLKGSLVCEIRFEINKLLKLRHLFGRCNDDKEIPMDGLRGIKVKETGSLKSLQKLVHIEANTTGFDITKELGPLTQLRTLGITKLRSEDGSSLCGCIEKMKCLESLYVSSTSEEDIIDLESMTCPPEFLRRLILVGPLRKLPDWITKLQNLAKISIWSSKLGDDPLKVLGILPELVVLGIHNEAFVGEQLHFEEGGFPKLKVLDLDNLKGMNSLIIEEGALPVLEKLYLKTPKLQKVPSGIQHLRNLEMLLFNDMPNELMESMDPNEGHNYQIVQHVPSVYFSCEHEEYFYRLRQFGWKQL
ncbi:hypothetical protein TIFTF001_031157 [Ficus carica]|uniref:Uncharacterized protein n=1 Tax=Ficus carica TaxID=3494 RepID=A0AA88J4T2_FICCA|nr:hypothetical protein TIFTF001_031157 [Ficus carica]